MNGQITHDQTPCKHALLPPNEHFPYIQERTREFVMSLDGRYRQHVSDTFLAATLANATHNRFSKSQREAAYNIAKQVFETLQDDCHVAGDSHDIAVKYEEMFK